MNNTLIASSEIYFLTISTLKNAILHTQEDKDRLRNIKTDIFENKLSTKNIVEKYFSYTDDTTSSPNNIALLNDTCRNVSRERRKLENRKDEYEVGSIVRSM